MPKAKFRADRGKKAEVRTYKFKLGNRKSSTSAHTLSSKDLIEKYNNPGVPKDKIKIAKVLQLRGISLAESALTEAAIPTE